MDKRTILALVLMALVIVVTPMLYQNPRRSQPVITDSSRANATPPTTGAPATPPTAPPAVKAESVTSDTMRAARPVTAGAQPPRAFMAETASVATPHVRWALQSAGAAPLAIQLNAYRDLRPGARDTMMIRQDAGPLLH